MNHSVTSRNPFFKGKLPACQLMYGRCVVCLEGGYPSWPILEGGTPAGPSRGGTPAGPSRSGGVHFRVHFWGCPLPCSLLGGPLLCSLPGGVLQLVHPEEGSTSMFTSGGVHFCVHFGGVPCDLSHNALIYCYRMPQCIMGKIHMGPPLLDRLKDKHE